MASFNPRIMPPQAAANVRVLVRIRPLNDNEVDGGTIGRTNVLTVKSSCAGKLDLQNGESGSTNATIVVNSGTVEDSSSARRRVTGLGSTGGSIADCENNTPAKQFTVDAVHGIRSSQADVYESVKEIVDAVSSGYNGTIVAYGQTGSGKTHTVFGQDDGDESKTGLIQRSLRDIFHKVTLSEAKATANDESEDTGTTITTFRSSFFEIFNERVYDLLANDSLESNLAVREDSNRVYVQGLKEVKVANTSEAENILAQGMANRHVAATNMNRTSSRSHAVFVLSVRSEHIDVEGLRKIRNSKFTLVDLAGSERQKSTAALGDRLKEASMINKSLLCLGHVINALVDREGGRTRHIPFRNSKLTFLLRDTWGGNSKTCLVATVSPSGKSLGETISTLQFAQRAKLIKNNAVLNEDTCGTVAALQAEVAKLRSQLEGSSVTSDTSAISNEEVSLNQSQYELIDALRRRAARAEGHALCLEKQASEEEVVVQKLKRKVREEVMTRKFKERRLSYLQTSSNAPSERCDQHRMMSEEISCLQKRIDTPSAEAIEWKVAYETVKETLQNQIKKDGVDTVVLGDNIQELEVTIERLCSEKVALEERVSDLTLSSSDTQDEIDSILEEVNRLESEMTALQDEVEHKENKVITLNQEAVAAKDEINELHCDLQRSNDFALKHKEDFSQLQKSSCHLSEEVERLSVQVFDKGEQIVELEMLSKEIEAELQITIDGLGEKLNESRMAIADKESAQLDLQRQVSINENTNLNLSQQIKEASSQINEQKSIVGLLNDKIKVLQNEKSEIIETLRHGNEEKKESHMKEIESLREEIKQISEERYSFKSEICIVKDKAEKACSTINEKESVIIHMKTKLDEMKDSEAKIEQAVKLEKKSLEDKLLAQKMVMKEIECKLELLKEEKQRALCKVKEDASKIEMSLHKEIKEMRIESGHWTSEKINLENNLAKAKLKYAEAECNVESQCVLLQSTQATLKEVHEEKNMVYKNATNERQQIERNLQGKIQQIQTDYDQMALQLSNSKHAVDEIKAKYEAAIERLNSQNSLVASLREQKSIGEKEKYNYTSEMNMRIQILNTQLEDVLKEKSELEIALEEKAQALSSNSKLLFDQKELVVELKKKILLLEADIEIAAKNEFEVKEVLRISHEREVKSFSLRISGLEGRKNILEVELLQCKEDSKTLADISHEKMLKKSSDLKSEMEKCRATTTKTVAELQCKQSRIQILEKKVKLLQTEKETTSIDAERRMKIWQSEQLFLKNHAEKCAASEEEVKAELLLQKDKATLLNRKKLSLDSELKTLQDSQDVQINQAIFLESQNKELGVENRCLKQQIEDMKKSHTHLEYLPSNVMVENIPSSPILDDSPTPFNDLSLRMDNMLEKINDQSIAMDETFDESLFLPNAEINAPDNKENNNGTHSNTPKKLFDNTSTTVKGLTPRKACTPSKLDYNVNRQPLADRKSNINAKGLSATQLKSNWMLFDNRTLFRNEKKCD